MKLAIALERAVSPKDVTAYPVLSELAGLIDTTAVAHGVAGSGRSS